VLLLSFFVLVFGFVVAVVASIWDDLRTNLISRQQLFFKKSENIFMGCGAAWILARRAGGYASASLAWIFSSQLWELEECFG
jgi:hypothetical protein